MDADKQSGGQALALGFLLAATSSFGQTFFVALFSSDIQAELEIGVGAFGTIYSLATVSGATCLMVTGHLADKLRASHLGALAMVGVAAAATLLAYATSIWTLFISLFGLRFCGQGMLSHVSLTATARRFSNTRGRALSVATLGFFASEAILPGAVALIIVVLDWREVWLVVAALLVVVAVPSSLLLGGSESTGHGAQGLSALPRSNRVNPKTESWQLGDVLHDSRFLGVLPSALMPAFIVTGVLFHQLHWIQQKGWSLNVLAASYPALAIAAASSAFVCGLLVDRTGALRIFPVSLLPMTAAVTVLWSATEPWTVPIFMVLLGATLGGAPVALSALWAELYGTENLGAIRSLVSTLTIFATALAPGLLGWLIDSRVAFDTQLIVMAVVALVSITATVITFRFASASPATS